MPEPIREPRSNTHYELLKQQLNLAGLKWESVAPDREPSPPIACTSREVAQHTIQLQDHQLTLEADHMHSDTHINELFVFSILDQGKPVIQLRMEVLNSKSGVTASTNIGKIAASRIPGMPLYEKVLEYIQDLSVQRRRNIKHSVIRSLSDTTLGRQVLDPDSWNKQFGPFLQEHGYIQKGDFKWEKTYQPS